MRALSIALLCAVCCLPTLASEPTTKPSIDAVQGGRTNTYPLTRIVLFEKSAMADGQGTIHDVNDAKDGLEMLGRVAGMDYLALASQLSSWICLEGGLSTPRKYVNPARITGISFVSYASGAGEKAVLTVDSVGVGTVTASAELAKLHAIDDARKH